MVVSLFALFKELVGVVTNLSVGSVFVSGYEIDQQYSLMLVPAIR